MLVFPKTKLHVLTLAHSLHGQALEKGNKTSFPMRRWPGSESLSTSDNNYWCHFQPIDSEPHGNTKQKPSILTLLYCYPV